MADATPGRGPDATGPGGSGPVGHRETPGERDGRPAPEPEKRNPSFFDLFWIGTGCAICIVGAGAAGYGLDNVFHLTPWLTFAGLAFGIVSAVLLAVANLRKYL